jgi:peptidyl-prolyl cis-trans isomerase C
MSRIAFALALAALAVAADCPAQAQAQGQGNPDEVFAENALVKLTRADYETALLSIPPDIRGGVVTDPKRLTQLLNTILIDKTLAQEARNAGLDHDPILQRRLQQEVDRFYAEAMSAKIEADAAAEFDAKSDQFLPAARETYVLNKAQYMRPEQISASHILFDSKRGDADALEQAKAARAKLLAGADFATLAREVSQDPTAKENAGALGWFGPNKMDPEFTKAAFALKNVGDISEPVHSSFGWHIIRLDGRRPAQEQPFAQVRSQIMAEMKQRYVKDARDAKLLAINKDPNMKVNQAAIDALVVPMPEKAIRRASSRSPGSD